MAATLALSLFAVALLLWFSPGREFADAGWTSVAGVRTAGGPADFGTFLLAYVRELAAGEAGFSATFQAPVAVLLRERTWESLTTFLGAAGGLAVASLIMALAALRWPARRLNGPWLSTTGNMGRLPWAR